MESETDQEKMDEVAYLMEELFPDCGFIIIGSDGVHVRYVGNMNRENAEEVMEELIDSFEADRLRNGATLN